MDTEKIGNISIVKIFKPVGKFLKKYLLYVIILGILLFAFFSIKDRVFMDKKVINLGFKDIGELVTQESYSSQIGVIDSSKDLFGLVIPFTQSKNIYSYDFKLKAGYDFSQVDWEKNDSAGKIIVKLPKVKLLSSEIILDSFKIYHEQQSLFNRVSLKQNNELITKLRLEAEKAALDNGFFTRARENAEKVLTAFFSSAFDLSKYKLEFVDK